MTKELLVRPATSYDWIDYFYQNAAEPALPWNDPRRLSGAERMAVVASIQQFQLGEDSSGCRLLSKAGKLAPKTGDRGFIFALRLFIREEQRHSRLLSQFLRIEGAECLRRHWVHSVFRLLRGFGSLEVGMKVLATAEAIARPYYSALRDATGSRLLRHLCELILNEERAHLRFQAFIAQKLRRPRGAITEEMIKRAHRAFLFCSGALVWMEHASVFRASGWTFRRFWREAVRELETLYA